MADELTRGLPLVGRWMAPDREAHLLWRLDRLPRPRDLLDRRVFDEGSALHQQLWDGGWTMLSPQRGRTLFRLARDVARRGVPGALVDCGVWNGGSTILLSCGAPDRPVWAFDSFQGLPEPVAQDGQLAAQYVGACEGSEAKLRDGLARFAPEASVEIRAGWFEDTFPAARAELGPIAVLHVDGDWLESVRLTLETFEPLVSSGGYIVIDDYGTWPGARRATDDYRAVGGIKSRLIRIDHTGRYWRKA